jgi:hypothetical protein
VLAIEPEVRGEQALLSRRPGHSAATEVEQQPFQIQRRNRLGWVEAEEAVGNEVLWNRNAHTL